MKRQIQKQAQTPTSKTSVEERTHFEHRELSESEALFLRREQELLSKLLPSRPRDCAQSLPGHWSQHRRCTLFASSAFRHFNHSAGITTQEPCATATYIYYCPYMKTSLTVSVTHSTYE